MSEINLTKREEKCDNCTKQVSFWICKMAACEIHGFYLFFNPSLHSATRKTVMMVLAHIKRKMKSADR